MVVGVESLIGCRLGLRVGGWLGADLLADLEKHLVIDLVTDLVAGWDIDLMDDSLTNLVVYGMDTDVEVDSSVE